MSCTVQWALNDAGTEYLHIGKLRPGKTAKDKRKGTWKPKHSKHKNQNESK